MPTGYTTDVDDGSVTELADYIETCTKAFLWEYRDELPLSAPLPTISTFRDDMIARAERAEAAAIDAIYKLEGMSDAECEAAASALFQEQVASARRISANSSERMERHAAMMEKVRAWNAPAPLQKIREFALEQLQTSAQGLGYEWPTPSSALTGVAWREEERARLQRNLERAREDVAKQRENKRFEQERLDCLHAELSRMRTSQ